MPGRAADMSLHAALAMQKVLAQLEAASKLMSNREKVQGHLQSRVDCR